MNDIETHRDEIAPAVKALLTAFHEDTRRKLELAPTDSVTLCQLADGSLCVVGADGWLIEYDDLDESDVIDLNLTSAVPYASALVEHSGCHEPDLHCDAARGCQMDGCRCEPDEPRHGAGQIRMRGPTGENAGRESHWR
ncbi:hypothetical protein ACIBG0_24345 [Nocardia sp. NPDC050630]|uniref:hypothetical protein n=1 Tax=Nocardia sp. NPDC050630 TaxID=3364321 RepID=UPI003792975F